MSIVILITREPHYAVNIDSSNIYPNCVID